MKPGEQQQQEDDPVGDRAARASEAISPATRPAPTTLIGLSGRAVLDADDGLGRRPRPSTGSVPIAWTVSPGHRAHLADACRPGRRRPRSVVGRDAEEADLAIGVGVGRRTSRRDVTVVLVVQRQLLAVADARTIDGLAVVVGADQRRCSCVPVA